MKCKYGGSKVRGKEEMGEKQKKEEERGRWMEGLRER